MVRGHEKDLKALLVKAGCVFVRPGKGSHEIWYSPIVGVHFVVSKGVLSRHLANAILRQAGLPKSF